MPAVSADDEANAKNRVPWEPAAGNIAETWNQAPGSLRDDDSCWVEVSACLLCSFFECVAISHTVL